VQTLTLFALRAVGVVDAHRARARGADQNAGAGEGKFMNDAEPVNMRIEQLETRIAYQDHTIEELNKSVTEQWRQIEALGSRSNGWRPACSMSKTTPAPRTAEPPPPHY